MDPLENPFGALLAVGEEEGTGPGEGLGMPQTSEVVHRMRNHRPVPIHGADLLDDTLQHPRSCTAC